MNWRAPILPAPWGKRLIRGICGSELVGLEVPWWPTFTHFAHAARRGSHRARVFGLAIGGGLLLLLLHHLLIEEPNA